MDGPLSISKKFWCQNECCDMCVFQQILSINAYICKFVNTRISTYHFYIRLWILSFRTFQECNVIKSHFCTFYMIANFFYRTFHSAPTTPYIKKYVFFLYYYIIYLHRRKPQNLWLFYSQYLTIVDKVNLSLSMYFNTLF